MLPMCYGQVAMHLGSIQSTSFVSDSQFRFLHRSSCFVTISISLELTVDLLALTLLWFCHSALKVDDDLKRSRRAKLYRTLSSRAELRRGRPLDFPGSNKSSSSMPSKNTRHGLPPYPQAVWILPVGRVQQAISSVNASIWFRNPIPTGRPKT